MDEIEDVERRERRLERRTGRRVVLGLIVGAAIGAVVGAVAGSIVSDVGTPTMWAITIGGAIFGGGIAAFWSGMSGLESPRPGREPSTTRDPLHDVGDATVEYPEEHDEAAEARRRQPD
jgi:ribose/xylose/arabinose/galactoside ABC-type transport system permease subunit